MGSEKYKKILDEWDILIFYNLNEQDYRKIAYLNEKDYNALRDKSLEKAKHILDNCEKNHISIACYDHEPYPKRLQNIFNPPCVLYYKGNIKEIDQNVLLTVVGTRNPSVYGQKTTGNLCYELAKSGIIIVSGFAAGIDSFAHAGALKATRPTIAVLGCGLDVNYPAKNKALKESVLQCDGALLSEMPPGMYPSKSTFPIRNRILSGISLGIAVMEAPTKSGALITAIHGMEQGKDVFCLPPHDIYNKRFDGVKTLLHDGAICLMSPLDVLEQYLFAYGHKLHNEKDDKTVIVANQNRDGIVLPSFAEHSVRREKHPGRKEIKDITKPKSKPQKPPLASEFDGIEEKYLYDALDFEPKFFDDLLAESGLNMQKALSILTEFEIAGFIVSYSGKRYGLSQEL